MSDEVLFELDGHVAVVTLNRPTRNALPAALAGLATPGSGSERHRPRRHPQRRWPFYRRRPQGHAR